MTFLLRALLSFLSLLPFTLLAQPKAQPCFFSEDFESDEVPAGWDMPWVWRTTTDGELLDDAVLSWRIGNAATANAGDFFPVPDVLPGNRFIMANDDAPPCPCDLQDVWLRMPVMDLTGRENVWLEFRAYLDTSFGGGPATVQVSEDGTVWNNVHIIPPANGGWARVSVDLSEYDDTANLWIRFQWTDNGAWAAGLAIDDVCLRERLEHDLALERVSLHDPTADPFDGSVQSLRYTMLPLGQAGPLILAAEVVNLGTAPLSSITAEFNVTLDGIGQGTFNTGSDEILAPGERRQLLVTTDLTPTATGELEVTATAIAASAEDDPADNTSSSTMMITGPGWDDHYSAMALDNGSLQGALGGTEMYILGNRFELIAPAIAHGITVFVAAGSEVGAEIRAVLFDEQFAVIDTSARYFLSQQDLENGAVYLSYVGLAERQPGDVFAGIQRLTSAGPLLVGISGNTVVGGSFHMQGITFDLSYPEVVPIVRLHLSEFMVGIDGGSEQQASFHVYPNPAADVIHIQLNALTTTPGGRITLHDAMGRSVKEIPFNGHGALRMEVSDLPSGSYMLRLWNTEGVWTERVVIHSR